MLKLANLMFNLKHLVTPIVTTKNSAEITVTVAAMFLT
jgi:hypothetical protein